VYIRERERETASEREGRERDREGERGTEREGGRERKGGWESKSKSESEENNTFDRRRAEVKAGAPCESAATSSNSTRNPVTKKALSKVT